MHMQSKQRLVGAVAVLTVVAVIFFVLLHRSTYPPEYRNAESVSPTANGPVKEVVKEVVYDLPLVGQTVLSSPDTSAPEEASSEDTFATTSAELRAKAAKTSEVTAHILRTKTLVQPESELDESVESSHEEVTPEAWVVQLVTFTDASQATSMAEALRSMGWLAYARATDVFVGPYIDRHKADVIKDQLQKKMHINGVVKKFAV